MGVFSWLRQFVVTYELNGSKNTVHYKKLDDERLLITTNLPNGETIETIAYITSTANVGEVEETSANANGYVSV
jgi:hypothetical protein